MIFLINDVKDYYLSIYIWEAVAHAHRKLKPRFLLSNHCHVEYSVFKSHECCYSSLKAVAYIELWRYLGTCTLRYNSGNTAI